MASFNFNNGLARKGRLEKKPRIAFNRAANSSSTFGGMSGASNPEAEKAARIEKQVRTGLNEQHNEAARNQQKKNILSQSKKAVADAKLANSANPDAVKANIEANKAPNSGFSQHAATEKRITSPAHKNLLERQAAKAAKAAAPKTSIAARFTKGLGAAVPNLARAIPPLAAIDAIAGNPTVIGDSTYRNGTKDAEAMQHSPQGADEVNNLNQEVSDARAPSFNKAARDQTGVATGGANFDSNVKPSYDGGVNPSLLQSAGNAANIPQQVSPALSLSGTENQPFVSTQIKSAVSSDSGELAPDNYVPQSAQNNTPAAGLLLPEDLKAPPLVDGNADAPSPESFVGSPSNPDVADVYAGGKMGTTVAPDGGVTFNVTQPNGGGGTLSAPDGIYSDKLGRNLTAQEIGERHMNGLGASGGQVSTYGGTIGVRQADGSIKQVPQSEVAAQRRQDFQNGLAGQHKQDLNNRLLSLSNQIANAPTTAVRKNLMAARDALLPLVKSQAAAAAGDGGKTALNQAKVQKLSVEAQSIVEKYKQSNSPTTRVQLDKDFLKIYNKSLAEGSGDSLLEARYSEFMEDPSAMPLLRVMASQGRFPTQAELTKELKKRNAAEG